MNDKNWGRLLISLKREKMLGTNRIALGKTRETLKSYSAVEEIKKGKVSSHFTTIEEMASYASTCRRCHLCKTRHNVVVGEGPEDARILFIGEAPGADEDMKGRPFIGRSGKTLRTLMREIGIVESRIYITNIIKCRPPNNRDPAKDEIESCKHYLKFQLKTIRPRVICALGTFAARWILETDQRIGLLRGKIFHKDGVEIIPTYHPSFILRNPRMKDVLMSDLKLVKETAEKEPSNEV